MYKICWISRSEIQCSAMCIDELACSAFKFGAFSQECQLGSKFSIDTTIGPADQTSQVQVIEDDEGMKIAQLN